MQGSITPCLVQLFLLKIEMEHHLKHPPPHFVCFNMSILQGSMPPKILLMISEIPKANHLGDLYPTLYVKNGDIFNISYQPQLVETAVLDVPPGLGQCLPRAANRCLEAGSQGGSLPPGTKSTYIDENNRNTLRRWNKMYKSPVKKQGCVCVFPLSCWIF